jgi:hypothetical protein
MNRKTSKETNTVTVKIEELESKDPAKRLFRVSGVATAAEALTAVGVPRVLTPHPGADNLSVVVAVTTPSAAPEDPAGTGGPPFTVTCHYGPAPE